MEWSGIVLAPTLPYSPHQTGNHEEWVMEAEQSSHVRTGMMNQGIHYSWAGCNTG